MMRGKGFRPLSRWIGSYTNAAETTTVWDIVFPAPLEVDRFLYKVAWKRDFELSQKFPAPLEVDRFLYEIWNWQIHMFWGFRPLSR